MESSALVPHYFYSSKSDVEDHYLRRSKNLNEDFEKRLVELKKKSQKSSFSPSLSPSFQFIDLCEIIKKHQPKYLFLENVANLVTQDTGGMYKTILKSLDRFGYYYPEASLILSSDKFRIPFLRR